ncbi:MAG: 1,4-dihydroxy-6-naphthoate synthase [Nitrospirae bacterium]|nr:1,4-dihydroxy-6-naphthoate synthase [Nitrospirota bacterium]
MKDLSLGYSPCPNDTFIFYALVHGIIDSGELRFSELLLDVETLNQKALKAELDLSKVSYHALGYLRKDYCLLSSGSALGKGCGPILVSGVECSVKELVKKKIAVPGKLTTACLLLRLFEPGIAFNSDIIAMPYDKIISAVKNGETDAGLIIHESRFTYRAHGLKKIIDLGEWWENETGLPIPLGGIIARKKLGKGIISEADEMIRKSVKFALENRMEPMHYIKKYSRELSDEIINSHINLYVNDLSVDMGEGGKKAAAELLRRAQEAGIIPSSDEPIFI